MDDDVRLAKSVDRMQSQKAGIARACADEPDGTRRELGQTGKQ